MPWPLADELLAATATPCLADEETTAFLELDEVTFFTLLELDELLTLDDELLLFTLLELDDELSELDELWLLELQMIGNWKSFEAVSKLTMFCHGLFVTGSFCITAEK